jgi:hypothetical protein
MALKILEHLPLLSSVTSWSAIAAMQTDNKNATEHIKD